MSYKKQESYLNIRKRIQKIPVATCTLTYDTDYNNTSTVVSINTVTDVFNLPHEKLPFCIYVSVSTHV